MTNQISPNEALEALRKAAGLDAVPATTHDARAIENQAGAALRPEYWRRPIHTPLGRFSRRSLAIVTLGLLLTLTAFAWIAHWRMTTLPALTELPEQDALAIMQRVHTDFQADKDARFIAFTPPDGERWRYRDAYTFYWNDSGYRAQVIILSYGSLESLNEDYRDRTRPLRFGSGGVYNGKDMVAETRSLPEYTAEWRAIRLGNILMLTSPNASLTAQQALSRIFVSRVAADHRDFIHFQTP